MGRRITKAKCTICAHPERARIELAHVSGVGLKAIVESFGVGRMAVWRHCQNHLTEADRAFYLADVDLSELAARANAENLALVDYIAIVRGVLMKQLQLAASLNDRSGVAAITGRLTDLLKLSANINGELTGIAKHTVTNNNLAVFIASPVFGDLQQMLVRALEGHPAALAKVLEGLDELEGKAAQAALPPPTTTLEGMNAHAA